MTSIIIHRWQAPLLGLLNESKATQNTILEPLLYAPQAVQVLPMPV